MEQDNVRITCTTEKNASMTDVKSMIFVNDEPFMENFPYSKEVDIQSIKTLDHCHCYESYEGTIIRVFNIQQRWYTGTNKKLCAMNSKWASKTTTFGLWFAKAILSMIGEEVDEKNCTKQGQEEVKIKLQDLYNKYFNVNHQYIFLLLPHKEERIVCRYDTPHIVHIGTFDEHRHFDPDAIVRVDEQTIKKPTKLHFKSITQMEHFVDTLDPYHIQGVILMCRNDETYTMEHLKILNHEYKQLFTLRGNNASLQLQYLVLRKNATLMHQFCQLYDFEEKAEAIENNLWHIANHLHRLYLQIYITKEKLLQDLEDEDTKKMIYNIHGYYLKTKQKTTPHTILDCMILSNPRTINKLIRDWIKLNRENDNKT